MSRSTTCHIDHCCDRHAMNTWVGITLYWRPKLLLSGIVAIGAVADSIGFWDMPVPKRLIMQGLVWLLLFEFVARIGRAAVDGWPEGKTRGVVLSAVMEGLALYLLYTFAIGMATVLVNVTVGTVVNPAMEGLQLFFVVGIGITQLVMALAHLRGSRDEATAWLRGLQRNWTWAKDLANEIPEGRDAK